MGFAENLVRFRKERGLTQIELASKIGSGIAQVRRYESGRSSPTLEVIVRIAQTLGVSADDLIFENGQSAAAKRLHDRELLNLFEAIENMSIEDRQAIKQVLDAFIVRARVEDAMQRATSRKAS